MVSRRQKTRHKPSKTDNVPPTIDPEAQAEIDINRYSQIAVMTRFCYEVANGIDSVFRIWVEQIQRIKTRPMREKQDGSKTRRNTQDGGPR